MSTNDGVLQVFEGRTPIVREVRSSDEICSLLKGYVAGIMKVAEARVFSKNRGARVSVGVYTQGKSECLGEFRAIVWKRAHLAGVFDGAMALAETVRKAAGTGWRELRVVVQVIERSAAKKERQDEAEDQ